MNLWKIWYSKGGVKYAKAVYKEDSKEKFDD